MMPDWCKDYFDEWYGELILDTIPEEITKQQANLLIKSLSLDSKKVIMDLGCGKGRHALALAREGFQLTALDFSQLYVDQLKAQVEKENLSIQTKVQDMRCWLEPDSYHAIYMMFTTFGYFSDEENEKIIFNIAASMKKGGKFLLDIENRDYIVKFFIHEKWREKNDGFLLERHKFFPLTSCLSTKRILVNHQGENKQSNRQYRLYSAHEIISIAKKAGLQLVESMGDYSGIPFQINSPRIIFVFENKGE